MKHARLSDDDLRYVRREFTTLAKACAGRADLEQTRALIRQRLLPEASYLEDDGTERVPFDYFALVDEAGGVAHLQSAFFERYRRAVRASGRACEGALMATEWASYLDGAYGVCLKRVSPEAIVEKEWLVRSLGALLAAAKPNDEAWRRALRREVARLDELVRDFAPCDRARFGGTVSRDRLITVPRAMFSSVFEGDENDARRGDSRRSLARGNAPR